MMDMFLSCDWGTSALRLNLVDGKTGHVIARESSAQGIAKTFTLWNTTSAADENNLRMAFYLNILQQHINNIEARLNISLNGVRLFISGMASSSIGFMELPYSELPFTLTGPDLNIKHLPAQEGFDYAISIISGVKSNDDVMRGEETQLIGCIDVTRGIINDEVFIFPGTHSKHIHVNGNKVTSFKTYMTGDFFELLSQKSILTNSIEKQDDIQDPEYLESFKQGVSDAVNSNPLNAVFKVRTNNLFNVYTKKQNFTYLSGLLIGSELKDMITLGSETIHLLCGSGLEKYYRVALEQLGLSKKIKTYSPQWVDEAVVRAHYKIYSQISS
jgi:2-dehydro-3-deoxygalactonokinase